MSYIDLARPHAHDRVPVSHACPTCSRVWTVHARTPRGKGLAGQRARRLATRCAERHERALYAAHVRAQLDLQAEAHRTTLEDFAA